MAAITSADKATILTDVTVKEGSSTLTFRRSTSNNSIRITASMETTKVTADEDGNPTENTVQKSETFYLTEGVAATIANVIGLGTLEYDYTVKQELNSALNPEPNRRF